MPYMIAVGPFDSSEVAEIKYITIKTVLRKDGAWCVVEDGIRLPKGSITEVMLKEPRESKTNFYLFEKFGFSRTSCELSGFDVCRMKPENCGEVALEIVIAYRDGLIQKLRSHSTLVFSHLPKDWELISSILSGPRFGDNRIKLTIGDLLMKKRLRKTHENRTFHVDITDFCQILTNESAGNDHVEPEALGINDCSLAYSIPLNSPTSRGDSEKSNFENRSKRIKHNVTNSLNAKETTSILPKPESPCSLYKINDRTSSVLSCGVDETSPFQQNATKKSCSNNTINTTNDTIQLQSIQDLFCNIMPDFQYYGQPTDQSQLKLPPILGHAVNFQLNHHSSKQMDTLTSIWEPHPLLHQRDYPTNPIPFTIPVLDSS
eukprot:TRINITY_DN1079_c0_g1_i8.p1 TRINITY_DN1079_c0_g1~~TRINITY_DN1079_c0_g1_i8.p1  ORF type:complete len:375 (-),score=65.19 TRINITY_DN1079_c0_g1_i8:729-1853(-)